jgi:type IV pilus assembly protein PilE
MNHTISHRYVSIFSFGEERKAYYNAITLFFFFSPMKLTTRGFTLVELMIVIAIIGILAAALFPSMTSYLKRSRDAARTSHLKDISTAVGAYFADKETYPNDDAGCVSSGSTGLNSNYMPKGVPKDPTTGKLNGCAVAQNYGYGSGTNTTTSSPQFFIIATLENDAG